VTNPTIIGHSQSAWFITNQCFKEIFLAYAFRLYQHLTSPFRGFHRPSSTYLFHSLILFLKQEFLENEHPLVLQNDIPSCFFS
jgi:hypothetical protein